MAEVIKDTGRKKFANQVVKKALPEIAGSAVEGAALGAGKLISEDALGRAEFNGENLIAHMGGGALLGGGAGAAIGGVKTVLPGVKGAFGSLKGSVANKLKRYTNSGDAAIELVNLPPAKQLKEITRNPNFGGDLVQYLRNDIDLANTAVGDLAQKNLQAITASKNKISTAIKELDEAANLAQFQVQRKPFFDNIKQRLNPYLDRTAAKEALGEADLKKLVQFEKTLDAYAKRSTPVTFSELNKLKQSFDDAAAFDVTKTNFERKVARDLRFAVKEEIETLGDQLDVVLTNKGLTNYKGAIGELKAANKAYSIGTTIKDPLLKKELKQQDLLSLKDIVALSAGSLIDPTLGGLAVLAGKAANSDLRRKISVLADIERANQATTKSIKQASEGFVSGARAVKKPIKNSLKVLTNSQLSIAEDGAVPKTRRAAFNNMRQNVNEKFADMDGQANLIALNTMAVNSAAPNTAMAMAATLNRALAFLASRMPQDNQGIETQLFKREYQPSDFELSQFERYIQAIEAPLTLLDDLQAGTLTQEHVEALREVYPELYNEIRSNLTDQIIQAKKPLPYSKRIAISNLFNIAADETMASDFIIAMQSNFGEEAAQQEPQGIKPTSGGAQKLTIAERSQTATQRVQSGQDA